MNEFTGQKLAIINEGDLGTEAFTNEYVVWLGNQIQLRDNIISLPMQARHAGLVAELEDKREQVDQLYRDIDKLSNELVYERAARHKAEDSLHKAEAALAEVNKELSAAMEEKP